MFSIQVKILPLTDNKANISTTKIWGSDLSAGSFILFDRVPVSIRPAAGRSAGVGDAASSRVRRHACGSWNIEPSNEYIYMGRHKQYL